jgi:hypothetical protein
MAFKYTNKSDISLPLAVFLMHDSYDYDPRPNQISATSIIKPLRQLVLSRQHADLLKEVDIMDLVSSRMGTAIHDGCEAAWTDPENVRKALEVIGLGNVADRIQINSEELGDNDIPVYVEQRHEKEVDGYVISGKYDLVLNGLLVDYKSTSVWTYIYDSNAEKYSMQGSIYKWLVPDRITEDFIEIQFIFTDWSSTRALQDKSYPQTRVVSKKYPLWSTQQTEQYIRDKLSQLSRLADAPQDLLPKCSDEDLWAEETKYKYFKDPTKMARATKVFDNMAEAQQRLADDGSTGTVVTFPGQVRACRYCPVSSVCNQAQELVAAGRLSL